MQGAVFERHLHSRLPFPLMGAVDEFSGRGWCVFLGLGTFSFGSSMVFSWRYVPRLKGVDQGLAEEGGRGLLRQTNWSMETVWKPWREKESRNLGYQSRGLQEQDSYGVRR